MLVSATARVFRARGAGTFDVPVRFAIQSVYEQRKKNMAFKPVILATVAALGLAACGDTVAERAVIGGAVGAGAGAVTGGSIVGGAAIGAAGNVLACELDSVDC